MPVDMATLTGTRWRAVHDNPSISPPTLIEEKERLRKWREVRRQAAADPTEQRLRQADTDRKTRLDQFETEKADRIRTAETRRHQEAEAIESRRMEKARAHLEALDDIDSARASLLAARQRSRRITTLLVAAFVALPTVIAAVVSAFFMPKVYESTSTFTVEGAQPFVPRNSLFNTLPGLGNNNMAAAFQLRAQLEASVGYAFEMQIDTTQGLVILTTNAPDADEAHRRNLRIIQRGSTLAAPRELKTLRPTSTPNRPQSRVLPDTLLTFFTSISLFSIIAIFFQSFRHYARD